MSAQVFVIEGELMGLNEYVNKCRSHWSFGSTAKTEQTDLVSIYIRKAGIKPVEGPVEIGVSWVEKRRANGSLRDVDNIAFGAKFILDALKKCEIIPDDNPRVVRNVYHSYTFNSDEPRVEVAVMLYDPNGRVVHYEPVRGLD